MRPERKDQSSLSLSDDAAIISAVRSGNIDRLNKLLARLAASKAATSERPQSETR